MTKALIPPEALEALMQKAFVDGKVAPGLFWDALLKSDLFVPLAEKASSESPESAESDQPEEIPLLMGVDSGGKYIIWLFTSPAAMADYTERDLPYRGMLSPLLFASLLKSEHDIVLIGPDGLTLRLHPDLTRSLSEGKVPEPLEENIQHIPKDAEVFVGRPAEAPTALENRFRDLFKGTPEVVEATFIQISDPTGTRLLLGLRLTEDSRDALRRIAQSVAKAAEGILEKGKTLDITLIDRSLKEAFTKWGTPFYKK